MIQRNIFASFGICILYALSTACSDGSTGFGGLGGGGSGKKSEASGESDGSEDDTPSEPVRIAGSYLTCNELNFNDQDSLDDLREDAINTNSFGLRQDGDAFIACGIYSDTTDEKLKIDSKIIPGAKDANGNDVRFESRPTAEESYYHFAASLSANLRSGATIEARIVGQSVNATKTTKTEEIQPLYSTGVGTADGNDRPDGWKLEYDASWQGSSTFAVRAIDPRDFCDNGQVREQLRPSNKFLAGLGGISGDIDQDSGDLDLSDNKDVCIEPLTTFNSFIPGSSQKDYLTIDAGCIFYQTNEPRLYIIPADDSDYNDADELAELQTIIDGSKCQ